MAQLLYYIIINEFINLNYEFLTICTLLSLSSQVYFIPNRMTQSTHMKKSFLVQSSSHIVTPIYT